MKKEKNNKEYYNQLQKILNNNIKRLFNQVNKLKVLNMFKYQKYINNVYNQIQIKMDLLNYQYFVI